MDNRKTIVLVDDDNVFRRKWAQTLRGDGFEVLEAASVKKAKELLKGYVDLAIIDLRLERDRDENDVSGLTLAAEVGKNSIPVIIFTGVAKRKAEEALKVFRQKGGSIPASVTVLDKDEPEAALKVVHDTTLVIIPKIFLVHGHDENAKMAVVECLKGFQVIVLRDMPGGAMSLLNKIDGYSTKTHFAVILVTPDDFGGLRAKPREKKVRARQNVIFEYGLFFGKLGAGNVVALHSEEKIEVPSDLAGIHYLSMDPDGHWRDMLVKEIKEALGLVRLSHLDH